jgi:phage recombination protein Bet
MSSVASSPARDHPSSSPSCSQPLPEIPKQIILDYLDATGLSPELTEAEKAQFTSVCQAFGLNPWKREVYATVYGEGTFRRFSVIVGYETYLKRAERTGRLDGWSSRIEGSGPDMKAIVEIHRRDWSQPLIHEVYFAEAVQKKKDGTPTAFWTKMPRFQLKKVCISQAFRLCFPDELGGLPHDAAELPDAETLAAALVIPSASPEPEAPEKERSK